MVISPSLAQRFINAYMGFLGTLLPESEKAKQDTAQWLVQARDLYLDNPTVLQDYRAQHPDADADADMLTAIAALKVQRWIYLKDTTAYSVWLDAACEQGYGVLGLTQRIRAITRDASGAILTAGLLPIDGRWVTDGLIEGVAWLGQNMRRDYTEHYKHLRQSGRFSVSPMQGHQLTRKR